MKTKTNILTKAGVLLIAVFMVFGTIPAVMADTDDSFSTADVYEAQKIFAIDPNVNTNKLPTHLMGVEQLEQIGSFGGVGANEWYYTHDGGSHDLGEVYTGVGLTSAGLLGAASTIDVSGEIGNEITEVSWCDYADYAGLSGNFELCEGGVTGGALGPVVATGTFTTGTTLAFMDLPLSTPVTITESTYTLAIYIDQTIGSVYPVAVDFGPSNAGGDWFYDDTTGDWLDLSDQGWGLDYNWLFEVYVSSGSGPGPVGECKEDQCDFAINGFSDEFAAKAIEIDGNYWAFNSEPKEFCLNISNLGDVGIGELKLLADVYEKICGPTVRIWDDYKYNLQCFPCCGADYPFDFPYPPGSDMPCDPYIPIGDEPYEDPEDWWHVADDGDMDSWALQGGEDNRWLTNNQAWRCTKGEDRSFGADADVYLGLSDFVPPGVYDTLTTPEFDVSGAACADITFWHWCEGEYTLDEDGCVVPADYGTIAYSTDGGATWTELSLQQFVAYDTNDEWVEINLHFMNIAIDENDGPWEETYADVCDDCEPEEDDIVIEANLSDAILQLKFIWHKDPCLQYEGWYIDGLEVTKTLDYELELVCQTHDIIELDPCDPEVGPVWEEFCFPLECDFEDDTWYEVHFTGQVFSPQGCEQFIDNNEFKIQFKIMDIHDIRCVNMEFSDLPGEKERTVVIGDEPVSVPVTVTIENKGTFAESQDKISVDLLKGNVIKNIITNDRFETDSLGDYSVYYFNFDAGPTNIPWRWSRGDDSISDIYENDPAQARSRNPGEECLVAAEEGSFPTMIEDTFSIIAPAQTIDLDPNNNWVESGYQADCGDPCDAHISFDAKWSLEPDGMEFGFALMPTEGALNGYVVWWSFNLAFLGLDETQNDWFTFDIPYEDLVEYMESISVYDTGVVDPCTGKVTKDDFLPECEFGLFVMSDGPIIQDWRPTIIDGTPNGGCVNPTNPIPWTGVLFDNWYISLSGVGETEVVATGTIEEEELLPNQQATVELAWDDVELCQHGLVADVNLEGDINPGNDECCVLTVIAHQEEYCFDTYIEDLTGGGQCRWHTCTNRELGDDYFVWCGVESEQNGQYVNNMDDGLISPEIDLSYDMPDEFAVGFKAYYEFAPGGSGVYTVTLYDAFGDGWNGNSLDVLVAGKKVLSVTLDDGAGPESWSFAVGYGDSIILDFKATGSWITECSYELYDTFGNLVTTVSATGEGSDWEGTATAVNPSDFVEVDIWKTFDHDNDPDTANLSKWVEIGKLSGSSGGVFKDEAFVVDTSTMNNLKTKVRFRMVSDESGVDEGCYIDDFHVGNVSYIVTPAPPVDTIEFTALCLQYSGGWSPGNPANVELDLDVYDDPYSLQSDPAGVPDMSYSFGPGIPNVAAGSYSGYPAYTFTLSLGTPIAFNEFKLKFTETSAAADTLLIGNSQAGDGDGWSYQGGVGTLTDDQAVDLYNGATQLWDAPVVDPSGAWSFTTCGLGYYVVDNYQNLDIAVPGLVDLPVLTWMDDQDDIDGVPSQITEIPDYPYVNMEGIGSDYPMWDTFERGVIEPWICEPGSGGNWWFNTDDNTTLPNDAEDIGHDPCDPCNEGFYTIPSENLVPYGYGADGTGLNNAVAFVLDLTDETLNQEFVEFCAQINYELNMESVFIEFSPDWEPGTPMESATWVTYWAHTPGDSYGDDTDGWISLADLTAFDDDNRWLIDEYIGQTVTVRFRLQTDGNGAPVGDGFAVDDVHLKLKYTGEAFFDDIPPQTSIFFDPTTGLVQLSPVDFPEGKASGVAATYYKIDGGAQEQGREFTLPEGTHTIEYWSVDNNGNEETHKFAEYTIDSTAPTVEITSPEAGIYFLGNKLLNFGSKAICLGKFTIVAEADDGDGLGINYVSFSITGAATDSGFASDPPYEYLFKKMCFGSLTIEATAADLAGLTDSDEITVTCFSLGLL